MGQLIVGAYFLVVAGLERVPALRFRSSRVLRPYLGSDLFYYATSYVVLGAIGVTVVTAGSAWLGALGVPRLAALGLPRWCTVLLALLVVDLGNYLAHYLLHRVTWLWEFHKIHHSSLRLDGFAMSRSHLVEHLAARRPIIYGMLILIGFPLDAILLGAVLFTFWAILNHANLGVNLRFLEPVLITPRLHRLHHVPATTHKNLGTLLTVWDQLLGLRVAHDVPPLTPMGVPDEVDTYPQGWLRQLVEPFKRVLRRSAAPATGPSHAAG